jgi:hypothetical protein
VLAEAERARAVETEVLGEDRSRGHALTA